MWKDKYALQRSIVVMQAAVLLWLPCTLLLVASSFVVLLTSASSCVDTFTPVLDVYPFTSSNLRMIDGVTLGSFGTNGSSVRISVENAPGIDTVYRAFLTKQQRITNGFKASFKFNLGSGSPQGFAFVFHGDLPSTPPVGSNAYTLGYQYAKSIAVEVDLVDNTPDGLADTSSPVPHVEVHTQYYFTNSAGSLYKLTPNPPYPGPPSLDPGTNHTMTVLFDPSQWQSLQVQIDSGAVLRVALNMAEVEKMWPNGLASIGFTSSASNQSYGSIEIYDFELSVVPFSPSLSTITTTSFTPDSGSYFYASNEPPVQPQGYLQAIDACGVPIPFSNGDIVVNATFQTVYGIKVPNANTQVVDLGTGVYAISFWISVAFIPFTTYHIEITMNNQPIAASPFSINLGPGMLSLDKSELVVISHADPFSSDIVAGIPIVLGVRLRDVYSNPTVLGNYDFVYGVLGEWNLTAQPPSISDLSYFELTFQLTQARKDIEFVLDFREKTNGTLKNFKTQLINIVPAPALAAATQWNAFSPILSAGGIRHIDLSFYDQYGNVAPVMDNTIEYHLIQTGWSHPNFPPILIGNTSLVPSYPDKGTIGLDISTQVAARYNISIRINDVSLPFFPIIVYSQSVAVRADFLDSLWNPEVNTDAVFLLTGFDSYSNPTSLIPDTVEFFVGMTGMSSGVDGISGCLRTDPGPWSVESVDDGTNGSTSAAIHLKCYWSTTVGKYKVVIKSTMAGAFRFNVTDSSGKLQSLSYSYFNILPSSVALPDASQSTVEFPSSVTAGDTSTLLVTLRDSNGMIRVGVDDSSFISVSLIGFDQVTVVSNLSVVLYLARMTGEYEIPFTLLKSESFTLSVRLEAASSTSNNSLIPISGSNIINCIPGSLAPSKTIYSQLPTNSVKPGTTISFLLYLADFYGNLLLKGGWQITFGVSIGDYSPPMVTDQGDGSYLIVTRISSTAANFIFLTPSIEGFLESAPTIRIPVLSIPIPDDPCAEPYLPCGRSAICTPTRLDSSSKNLTAVCSPVLQMRQIEPSIAEASGGIPITVSLVDPIPDEFSVTLAGQIIDWMPVVSNSPSEPSFNQFTFLLPEAARLGLTVSPTSAGLYLSFNLTGNFPRSRNDTRRGIFTRTISNAFFIVNNTCIQPGKFWIIDTNECVPCSPNAYCPGGARAWPKPGYYSTALDQYEPTKCLIEEACKGYDPNQATEVGYTFLVGDAQCNTDGGYVGVLCSQCSDEYYLDQQKCRSCGLDGSTKQRLTFTIIAAFVIFSAMALGVAFISDERLALYVQIIVFIQQLSFVGSIGASRLSGSGAAEFFTFLSLLNFEISYFKLGCTVPQVSYVQVFWSTVIMIFLAAILLLFASAMFSLTRKTEYLTLKQATRWKIFSRRVQNSATILGVVVYLQLTTQFIRGIFCVELNGESVLQVEPSTRCYHGAHQWTAAFIWPFFFLYTIGFPCICFYLVLRTRYLNLWLSSSGKFAYLYHGLRIRWIWFKSVNFVTSFALALQVTLSTAGNVSVRLVTACCFFALQVFLVGTAWPYYRRLGNLLAMIGGIGNALSGLAILTVLSDQVGSRSSRLGSLDSWNLFAVGLSLLMCLILLILPARWLKHRLLPADSKEDDELLQRGHFEQLAKSRIAKGYGIQRIKTSAKQQPDLIDDLTTTAIGAAIVPVNVPLTASHQARSDDPVIESTEIEMQAVSLPTADESESAQM